MHSLDDVSTVVKYASDVLRVDGTCKMRVTIMFTISTSGADALKNQNNSFKNQPINWHRNLKNQNQIESCIIFTNVLQSTMVQEP